MRLQFKQKKLMVTVLVVLTLMSGLYPLLPVHAAVTIYTLSPNQGPVGSRVSLNGTINNSSGNFSIFFDSVKVGGARAVGFSVIASFSVPQATIGNHTVTLQQVSDNTNATQNFKVVTSYGVAPFNLPAPPKQVQEGGSVQIKAQVFGGNASVSYQKKVNVTIPTGAQFTGSASFPTVNATGTAETVLNFPTDFIPAGLHMNYTGNYNITIFADASTPGGHSQFFVGVTDATNYHRLDAVNIKAMNYTKTNEYANITITLLGRRVNQASIRALTGEVNYNWTVPANASIGTYTVTVKTLNSTGGTVKSPPDTQTFTVPGFEIDFFTKNLNLENVANVNVTVLQIDPFNASKRTRVNSNFTDSSGRRQFTLERGNYTLDAFWNPSSAPKNPTYNALVNETTLNIIDNRSWTIICQLTRVSITVFDGKTGLPLPFVFFVINSTYVTVSNTTQHVTQTASTNTTTTMTLHDQLISATYTVNVFRAPRPFNTTGPFKIPSGTKTYSLNITCPAFSLNIHVDDARGLSVGSGFPIKIFEYAGGIYGILSTDNNGDVNFTAASGQYSIRLYNPDQTIVLNQTYYILMNASSLLIRSIIFNANLSVHVVGYLGQPIPNVEVRIEPENRPAVAKNTDGNGVAFFGPIIGGPTFVSVYVNSNSPSDTAQVTVEGNAVVTLSVENYMSVFGLLVNTSQFAVLLTFIVFVIVFVLVLFYWQRRKPKTSPEPAETT